MVRFARLYMLVLTSVGCAGLTQQQTVEGTSVWRTTLLEQTLSFGAAEGRVAVPIHSEKITIEGFQEVSGLDFPFRGLLLVQLRAGELKTVIGDESIERKPGDFWLVPPGSSMTLETEDDKAIIVTYLIGEDYLRVAPQKQLRSSFSIGEGNFSELVPNLFSREAFLVGDPDGPVARVMDFNVGPGQVTESYTLAGPAVLQVTSGRALLTVDDKQTDSDIGFSLGVDEGQSLSVDNRRGERPFRFRAVIWEK